MRAVLCLVAAVAGMMSLAAGNSVLVKDTPFTETEVRGLFHDLKVMYNRTYASPEEEARRLAVFRDQAESIRAHNVRERAGLETYKRAANVFFDLTTQEFRQQYLSPMPLRRDGELHNVRTLDVSAAPPSVDWRDKGAVTPIKNQGQCGSCWAFSVTGSLEGRFQIAFGTLRSLSEQQLVDCSDPEGDAGCNGGLMDDGYKYVEKNHGIASEAEYPYVARDQKCSGNETRKSYAGISSYVDLPKNDEEQMKAAVAEGPIAVAMDAMNPAFQSYHSGIMDIKDCGDQPDHTGTAVGYGTSTDGKEYWIIKNQWGTSWGDQGYLYIARGKNMCAIASMNSYPIPKQV